MNLTPSFLLKARNSITKRFTFKHRNSLEISVFLAHLKKLTKVGYYPISEAEDKTLTESCFPAIDKVIHFTFFHLQYLAEISKYSFLQNFIERRNPVWILAKEDLEDVKILETIKQNYLLLPTDETVVLLHDLEDDNEEFMTLSNWCEEQNWKFLNYYDVMGSEGSFVILYDVSDVQTELYSRAKNCLIIVDK